MDIDKNKVLWDAVGILTNNHCSPSDLAYALEITFRSYSYNHIALEEEGVTSKEEAITALNILGLLLDGARGKFLSDKQRAMLREDAK